MKKVLVTGGAGYIGSHTLVELINSNYQVVVVDNLVNSSSESIRRVEQITGREVPFYEVDVCDQVKLDGIFAEHNIEAVIHFAGLKAVGESVALPLKYYENNLISTLSLMDSMKKHGVNKLIFSSSSTVYGTPEKLPLTEESPVGIGLTNPYGKTKYMIEEILRDACLADPELEVTILRYFNPVGAHESGLIGEDPSGIPNNLLPYVSQVAVGKLEKLGVFGDDYDTVDGTGVRDYIHVVDLARGHVAALDKMKPGALVYNLGTGQGVSVLEIVKAFEKVAEREIPYEIKPRRPGDIAACYANCQKAADELDWRAELTIDDACRDSWRWQSQNPNGFKG